LCYEWTEEFKDDVIKSIEKLKTVGYTLFAIEYGEPTTNFGSVPFSNVLDYNKLSSIDGKNWGTIWAK
jgi:hypothetical protein